MLNKNTKIKVKNRSTGSVGYVIPDMGNYHRNFEAGESKEIPFEELQKLSYIPGGDYILQHYLVIDNLEARDEILGNVELEYDYTEQDVKHLLENGSLDQLLDCLDFAPKGVLDLVKAIAVKSELNDMRKRKAIMNKLNFNVTSAIEINAAATENTSTENDAPARRVAPTAAPSTQPGVVRRAVAPIKK